MEVVSPVSAPVRVGSWSEWWSRARASATARASRGWYAGAAFGLVYQVFVVIDVWTYPISMTERILASVILFVLYAGWMLVPPLFWWAPIRDRLVVLTGYWLVTFLLFPLIGATTLWVWVLVGSIAGVLLEEFIPIAIATVILVAPPLVIGIRTSFDDPASFSAIIIFAVTSLMYVMNRQIRIVRELRQAQSEVARLAVIEERNRFSRDMHDVVGHSLTVVTVKSELARRLITLDPAAAEAEIADIERLTRSALADLRAAVTGYRQMTLSTELAVAQAALASANITAHLPNNGEDAASDLRELFGWVLREAVTNVIRHSGARNCWVTVTPTELTVWDDGPLSVAGDVGTDGRRAAAGPRGAAGSSANGSRTQVGLENRLVLRPGNGLKGLAERAEEAGAVMSVGTGPEGGCMLTVSRVPA